MVREPEQGSAREHILERLLAVCDGVPPSPDQSMRQLASMLGTTHGLLRYHFGSYEGLLAAMLAEQRKRDNLELNELCADLGFRESVEAVWGLYGQPEQQDRFRAFFYVAARAAYNPSAFTEFLLTQYDLYGLFVASALREGADSSSAESAALMTIATIRGLIFARILGRALPADDQVTKGIMGAAAGFLPSPSRSRRA